MHPKTLWLLIHPRPASPPSAGWTPLLECAGTLCVMVPAGNTWFIQRGLCGHSRHRNGPVGGEKGGSRAAGLTGGVRTKSSVKEGALGPSGGGGRTPPQGLWCSAGLQLPSFPQGGAEDPPRRAPIHCSRWRTAETLDAARQRVLAGTAKRRVWRGRRKTARC